MGIKYEQVANAAEAIMAQGGNPTMAAIRERIGSGSFSTITKFMQRWRLTQPTEAANEFPVNTPHAAMIKSLEAIWTRELGIHTSKFKEDAEREVAELAELIDRQAAKIKQLESDVIRLTRERTEYEVKQHG